MAHDNPLRIPEPLRHDTEEIFISRASKRAAWKDAEELKKAVATRPLRQKATR